MVTGQPPPLPACVALHNQSSHSSAAWKPHPQIRQGQSSPTLDTPAPSKVIVFRWSVWQPCTTGSYPTPYRQGNKEKEKEKRHGRRKAAIERIQQPHTVGSNFHTMWGCLPGMGKGTSTLLKAAIGGRTQRSQPQNWVTSTPTGNLHSHRAALTYVDIPIPHVAAVVIHSHRQPPLPQATSTPTGNLHSHRAALTYVDIPIPHVAAVVILAL
eukprot:357237-Chlamydomonas_euryale.AAC.1